MLLYMLIAHFFFPFHLFYFSFVLEIEVRALCFLGKCFITELNPRTLHLFELMTYQVWHIIICIIH